MRTINEAREFINNNFGREVFVKVLGIRNKEETMFGTISECYRNIFIVKTVRGKKSFNYTDVLIGNIKILVK